MPPTPSCDSQATGGSKNARNVLRVSSLDSLSKIYLFLSSPQWPAGFTPSHAIAEKNLALLSGGGRDASDPLLRLAGHWWEQKRSKRAASLMSGFFVKDLLVFELPPVACRFHAVAEENLAWLRGVQLVLPTPSIGGTCDSQATGGSLQVLIGGVPVPGRHGVAQMEWVPRRPLGRAFSSKFWEWRWIHEHNIAPKSPPGGQQMGQHSPNIAPRWANLAPT